MTDCEKEEGMNFPLICKHGNDQTVFCHACLEETRKTVTLTAEQARRLRMFIVAVKSIPCVYHDGLECSYCKLVESVADIKLEKE